jgi:predicted RNA-binding protein with PIN domain
MPAIPETVHRCRLLVDGYNLLFGQGWAQPNAKSHPTLQRGRETLVSQLAARTTAEQRPLIWIIFDSLDAPSHLPSSLRLRDMEILFSREWASADELLREILVLHTHPKSLVVISSDHSVQRKAIARGATPFDHDQWIDAIEAAFGCGEATDPHPDSTEHTKDQVVGDKERDEWMKRFGF